LNCSYEDLITRPLTISIYKVIKEKGELTTTQAYNEVREMGHDEVKNTVLKYLNTMSEYNLLYKDQGVANLCYWSLGSHALRNEELLKVGDSHIIQDTSPYDLYCDVPGFHLYGFPRTYFEKYYDYTDEIDFSANEIEKHLKTIRKIRYDLSRMHIGEKISEWGKHHNDPLDKPMFFCLLTSALMSFCDRNYTKKKIRVKRQDGTFEIREEFALPEWLVKTGGKYEIRCNMELATVLQKLFFPDKKIGEIMNTTKNYTYHLSTLFLCYELLDDFMMSVYPLFLVAHYDVLGEISVSNYISRILSKSGELESDITPKIIDDKVIRDRKKKEMRSKRGEYGFFCLLKDILDDVGDKKK